MKKGEVQVFRILSLPCVRRGYDQAGRLQGKCTVLEFTKGY